MEKTTLIRDDKRNFFIDKEALTEEKESLYNFVENEDLIKNYKFNKASMPKEIKSNNAIEGIDASLSDINKELHRKMFNVDSDEKRITNLYKGYRYILGRRTINKERLKKLYGILSDDLLDNYAKENMGEYYRNKDVYILKGASLENYYLGIKPEEIDKYMNILFDFINNEEYNENQIESFIKAHIIHFYFVYIHPYFDVNGRTSRTVAMWHLLNNDAYPYLNFNRSISFLKSKYEKAIIKTRETGLLNYFLDYMLKAEKLELEKEYVIKNIEKNLGKKLTDEEYLMLENLLSVNSNLTLLDLINFYNDFNTKKKKNIILEEDIYPLIDKKIIILDSPTKKDISDGNPNYRIKLNQDLIDVDERKIKRLNLNYYTKKDQD